MGKDYKQAFIWHLLVIVCFSAVLVFVSEAKRPYTIEGKILHFRTCKNEYVYRNISQISFPNCVRECNLRTRCQSVMYRGPFNLCGLMDTFDFSEIDHHQTSPICIFAGDPKWTLTPEELGTCSQHQCNSFQRCTESSGTNSHTCPVSECNPPPEVLYASPKSHVMDVGSTTKYTCLGGLKEPPNTQITCQEDGNWSQTNFICIKQCRRLDTEYPSATLDNQNMTNFVVGTHITFVCKEGYHNPITSTNVSSHECNSYGRWRPFYIICCNESMSFNTNFCYTLNMVNSSIETTYEELPAECKKYNAYLAGYDRMQRIVTNGIAADTEWLVIGERKSQYTDIYRNCVQNITTVMGTTIAEAVPDLGNKDIAELNVDELAAVLKKFNFTGNYCRYADVWDEGMPNKGPEADCLILKYGNDNMPLLQDINCTSPIPVNTLYACFTNTKFIG